jgi:hypothetical protein
MPFGVTGKKRCQVLQYLYKEGLELQNIEFPIENETMELEAVGGWIPNGRGELAAMLELVRR